ISNLSVTMSDLVNSRNGKRISASSTDILVYREGYLNITSLTNPNTPSTFFTATGYYPDILIPAVDPYYHQAVSSFTVTVAGNRNQSFWIDVHIPTSAPSGYYGGTVTVTGNGTTLSTMSVVYGVWAWQMPSTTTLISYL